MTDIIPEAGLLTAESYDRPEDLKDFSFELRGITPADTDLWRKMGELRGRVYYEAGFVEETALNKYGQEYDEYDERSEHFVALDANEDVIGTLRLVSRGDALDDLPAEKEFDNALPGNTKEISRFIHAPELLPTEGLLVSLGLMRAAYKATKDDTDTVYAVIEQKLFRELDKHIGIEVTAKSQPRIIEKYRNTTNILVEMHPRLITSQVYRRDQRVRTQVENHPALAESILGKPFAPFFEKNAHVQGLGRVSLGDMVQPLPEQYDRNAGFFSPEQQERLWNSTISLAGAGGDGGQLAEGLARSGVRHFKIADPEVFGIENLNRQAGATYATIGHNKAEVLAETLRSLGAEVEVFTDGITPENVTSFVAGSDLVIDETEYTMPELGVMLAREARHQQKSVLMALNVGFGSYVNSFHPKGMTFEKYLGLDENMSLEEIAAGKHEVQIAKWAPHIPRYANTDVLQQVARGERSAPTVVQGVYEAAADASMQAIAHLLSDTSDEWGERIVWAPHGKSVDVIDGSRIVKHRASHFGVSVAIAALRTKLGKNKL